MKALPGPGLQEMDCRIRNSSWRGLEVLIIARTYNSSGKDEMHPKGHAHCYSSLLRDGWSSKEVLFRLLRREFELYQDTITC